MGGVWPTWPGGGDVGSWPDCLLVELLVKGTICTLTFYYMGYTLSGQIIMISEYIFEAQCMNSCMGGVWPDWPGAGDMCSWPACLLVEFLVKGTVCILAFYYIGYTLRSKKKTRRKHGGAVKA